MSAERELLRHFLAALAYRTGKALRDAPAEFGDFRAAPGVRTPRQIVRHMSDVLGYARVRLAGGSWRARSLPGLAEEAARFHEVLAALDREIETAELGGAGEVSAERLLQGPLADAMTHAGQLAMLRRMAGAPIPPENFIEAEIETGQVGSEQPDAVSLDRDWYAAEDEPY